MDDGHNARRHNTSMGPRLMSRGGGSRGGSALASIATSMGPRLMSRGGQASPMVVA